MTDKKKFYKVWIDSDFSQPFAGNPEIVESDTDNDKMGDYAVFNSREEAQRFIDTDIQQWVKEAQEKQ